MTRPQTNRSIAQLERDLRGDREDVLSGPALAGIRTRGRARRRVRAASYLAGVAAAAVATGGVVGLVVTHSGDGGSGPDGTPVAGHDASRQHPRELSPLAERAIAELGAVQVSEWQVVVPTPVGTDVEYGGEEVPDDYVVAGPVDIGARGYAGVTAYPRSTFPAWLWDGVEAIEKATGSEEEGYPVGSTDMGIIVDSGPLDLACMQPLPQWTDDGTDDDGSGEPRDPDEPCFPAMLGTTPDGVRTYEWGMGTDDFLQEGEDLELFSTEVFYGEVPQTVWIGGTDGTEVARVDLVATDGTVVEASVAAGDLVPGETMFWGTVTGDLAAAVTYDEDGNVLEDHTVKPCDNAVECEVR